MKRLVLLVGVVMLVATSFLLFRIHLLRQISFTQSTYQESPLRLRIPSIGVYADIETIDLTETGALETPRFPQKVGWFKDSGYPGDTRTVVMDGHSGWKDYMPAVFDTLYKVRVGDRIHVDYSDKPSVVFVVYKVKTFDYMADTTTVFHSEETGVYLNLITCAGTWDEVNQNSSDRIVVFSKME